MKIDQRGDGIRVVHPLFQTERGGANPTSPLQLRFGQIDVRLARDLVRHWHSRLPEITNWQTCVNCYGAEHDGIWYAVAMWGMPVAREFNGRGYIELRRMAVSDDAPKNTASRMLAWMVRQIKAQGYKKAISYQDCEVHKGTIYKAAGWVPAVKKWKSQSKWDMPNRKRATPQSSSEKVRWELDFEQGE